MNLNKIFLVGRLTRDPENKSLPSGTSVTSFGLATDRFYSDKSGQKQQQTEFHNIVMFGKLAEIASKYLTKGALTLIEGRIQTRSWQDSSGVKKYRTEILAERMQLGPRSTGGRTAQTAPPDREEAASSEREMPGAEDIPIVEEGEIDIKDIPL
ncbi:MAG: single-stranded DNA-binding protein [Candidatus Wildermuthbacteria bacterium]|nr:single-stranded DNA-binding protein [Candidatus Wildermuthbacteria bacterium]